VTVKRLDPVIADKIGQNNHRLESLGWLWLLAIMAFQILFLLPRKGVDFSDEGWILSAAMAAARGWHLDLVVPQAPMWAINALFIAIGLDSYLALRFLFLGLISLCLWISLTGIKPPSGSFGLRAALITFAGLTSLSSLISYNNTPQYLVLAGVGLLLLAAEARPFWERGLLAIFAGLALSMAGFLNFTMYPAALISLGLVWLAWSRSRIIWVALAIMAITGGPAIFWYLHRIGLHNFMRYPGGHGVELHRFLVAIRIVLEWIGPALLVWALWRFGLRGKFQQEKPPITLLGLTTAIILGLCLLFFLVMLKQLGVWQGGGWLDPVLRLGAAVGLEGLGLLGRGTAFNVMATWGLAVLIMTLVLCAETDESYRRVLLCSGCLYLCYLWQEFFSLMDPRGIPVYYAGPCLALGFYLLMRRPGGQAVAWLRGAALVITFAGGIIFSLFYNQPNLNSLLGEKVDVPIPKLRGLKESPQRLETLQALCEAFDRYDCRGRTLVTFQATPLLYYLFEAEPPRGLEYIYVPQIYFPDRILQTLRESSRWCVFVSWNWLNFPGQRDAKARTLPILEYLQSHSQKIVRLSPREKPAHCYDDFVLYLGPVREYGPPPDIKFRVER
jgi:hypothetical protein